MVLRKRMHDEVIPTGRWLGRVLRGWLNYYAVPTSFEYLRCFVKRLQRIWCQVLRERSQKDRFSWERLLCAAGAPLGCPGRQLAGGPAGIHFVAPRAHRASSLPPLQTLAGRGRCAHARRSRGFPSTISCRFRRSHPGSSAKLALTWAAGYTRPRMGTDAIQPSRRLALAQRVRSPLALTWAAGYTRPRMVTDAIHPSCRLALQPDNPTTRQPDNPTTRQPDNPTTRQPDNPTTRQPDNPTTRQPDNRAPLAEPLRQPRSGRPLGPGAERTIDPRGIHPPRRGWLKRWICMRSRGTGPYGVLWLHFLTRPSRG